MSSLELSAGALQLSLIDAYIIDLQDTFTQVLGPGTTFIGPTRCCALLGGEIVTQIDQLPAGVALSDAADKFDQIAQYSRFISTGKSWRMSLSLLRRAKGPLSKYTWWIPRPSRPERVAPKPVPSIPMGGLKWSLCPWLSSSYDRETSNVDVEPIDDEPGTAEQTQPVYFDEAMTSNVNYEHRDPQLWASICAFFGCDPLHKSPNSRVYFRGWNKNNFMLAYQLSSTDWVLQRLLFGEPAVFVAHDRGLGKTAIVVAEIWIMLLLIEDSKKAIDVENFRHSRYFDARTLMDNRGHLQPAHRNGSYSGSCYASVAQRMGYQHPQLTRAEKDFYYT
ncbi:hypothetical protein D6D06_09947 [Aureobasidium pullulans]|nr:hypothetical protein D6D06_09947 [Aureobasidium pullulans]